jgi:hypothetical protein
MLKALLDTSELLEIIKGSQIVYTLKNTYLLPIEASTIKQ